MYELFKNPTLYCHFKLLISVVSLQKIMVHLQKFLIFMIFPPGISKINAAGFQPNFIVSCFRRLFFYSPHACGLIRVRCQKLNVFHHSSELPLLDEAKEEKIKYMCLHVQFVCNTVLIEKRVSTGEMRNHLLTTNYPIYFS